MHTSCILIGACVIIHCILSYMFIAWQSSLNMSAASATGPPTLDNAAINVSHLSFSLDCLRMKVRPARKDPMMSS